MFGNNLPKTNGDKQSEAVPNINHVQQPETETFPDLPPVINNLIYEYLFDYNGGVDTAKPDLFKFYKTIGLTLFGSEIPVIELAQAVVGSADYNKVKKLLDKASADLSILEKLLTTTFTINDPHHRKRKFVNRTVLQLALGAEDYDVDVTVNNKTIRVLDGIAELITSYFTKLSNGETLWNEQRNAQIPQDSEEKEKFEREEKEKFQKDLNQIHQIINAVRNASDAVCQQTMVLDSFHGTDLRPSTWASNDQEVLASVIYLKEEKTGLSCRFRKLDGTVGQKSISWDELKNVPDSADKIIQEKEKYLPILLNQIAEPGVFYSATQISELRNLADEIVTADNDDAFDAAWNNFENTLKEIVGSLDFTLLKSIYEHRYCVEPKGLHTKGLHYNLQLSLEVDTLYDKNFAEFGNDWASPKNVFCWQKIRGLRDRLEPSCVKQIKAQGSYSILELGNKCNRTFNFTYGGGAILPLDSRGVFRLGYNYAARGAGVHGGVAWGCGGRCAGGLRGKLMSSKNSSAGKFTIRPGHTTKQHRCVVM